MVQEHPTVSIITNCLNGAPYLDKAITSVLNQTYENWRLIIFDNGSSDGCLEALDLSDKRIRVVKNKHTVSLPVARNRAMKLATTSLICFLDTDDTWEPSKLERQVSLMNDEKDTLLCFTNGLKIDERGRILGRFCGKVPCLNNHQEMFRYLFKFNPICMSSVMINTKIISQGAFKFDPRLEIYLDYDLFRRIAFNHKIRYLDENLFAYRVHENSLSHIKQKKAASEARIVLENILNYVPSFKSEFNHEYNLLKRNIQFQEAKYLWRLGQSRKAYYVLKNELNFLDRVFYRVLLSLNFEFVVKVRNRIGFLKSR